MKARMQCVSETWYLIVYFSPPSILDFYSIGMNMLKEMPALRSTRCWNLASYSSYLLSTIGSNSMFYNVGIFFNAGAIVGFRDFLDSFSGEA